MTKKIFAIVIFMAIALPCLLMFDGGPRAAYGDETFRLTNAVGFVWFAFLALGGYHAITPKWVRKELESYMSE